MRTLHYTPLCSFCRKVRIQLKEKKLPFELEEERPWARRESLLQMNPSGEVPVLVDDDGRIVCEAMAITEYIEECYPDNDLLGKNAVARAEVRRLESWFDVKFNHEVTRNLVFEKYFKKLYEYGHPYSDAIRAGKANILYHLDYIGFLSRRRKWLAGDHITLADIAAAAHLSALDYFGDVPWDHDEDAKEWYALVKSRPSFRPILNDRVPGFKPPEHYDDLDF